MPLKDRCRFFDIAHGSALECAAGLDVLVAQNKLTSEQIRPGKERLQRVVRMLMGLIKRIRRVIMDEVNPIRSPNLPLNLALSPLPNRSLHLNLALLGPNDDRETDQTPALRNRQAAPLEARLEHGPRRACSPSSGTSRRLKRGEFFPPFLYVSIINSLQPALPGLLGRRRGQAGDHSAGGVPQADPRSEGDGQRLLRHRRRRAVHAPAAVRDARAASGLLLPDLHQRPLHHRREGQALAAARQRHAAHQRRGDRDRQRRAPRPGRRAVARRCRASRTA